MANKSILISLIFYTTKKSKKMSDNAPITTSGIRAISLCPMTEEYILSNAACRIDSTKQFADNEPVPGGTYDARMGPIFETYPCGTCNRGLTKCPGHFGYYQLSFPIQHMVYEKIILKNLRLICIKCFRYIMDPSIYNKKVNSTDVSVILKHMTDTKILVNKKIYCDHCNNIKSQKKQGIPKAKYVANIVQPKYKKSLRGDPASVGYQVQYKFKDGKYTSDESKNKYLTMIYNDEILALFEKLPDSELVKFGLPVKSHPRHFLSRYLYILPANLRFINNDKSQSYNNQITTGYEKVIKENEKIKPKPSKTDNDNFDEYISCCKSMVAKYLDMIKSPNEKTDTITARATGGKKGKIRKDLLAKQVGATVRDVIVCSMDVPPDTISFPLEQAKELVIEEHVTPYNRVQLQKILDNGEKYPGCTIVKPISTGIKRAVRFSNGYTLVPGDIIYRHLITGDTLPWHRHPTLTPTCITSMKLKVNSDPSNKSVGMNPAACAAYNADFDGDMMNGYVVSKEKERIETAEIMGLQNMFPEARVSAGGNSNVLGQIQDAVIGISLLTRPGVVIPRINVINMFRDIPDKISFTKNEYTGREIFSLVLPDINYEADSPIVKNALIAKYLNLTEDDTKIRIKRGQLLSGIVCDSVLKDGYGSLYHTIFHTHGSKVALESIHKHQLLIRRYLEIEAYTIGFTDILYGKETEKLINLVQSNIMTKLKELDNMLLHRKLVPPIGTSMRDHLLNKITEIHAQSEHAYLGAILQTVKPMENNIFKSIIFGAKGKLNNLYAIMACVGLIKLDGKFVPQKLAVSRHSIFLRQFSSEPAAFGYVHESYKNGIGHQSMSNTSSGARQNILTKSMGTGEAGAEGRNIIKTSESVIVTNNQFAARNNGLSIIEFAVGDDGFESILCMQNDYSPIQKSDADIRKMMQPTTIRHKSVDKYVDQIIADKHSYLKYNQTREKIGFIYKCNYKLVTPADYKAIISRVMPDEPHKTTDKEMISMISLLEDWIANVHYIRFNPINRQKKRKMLRSLEVAFNSVRIATRFFLNPKFLETCSPDNLQLILKTIEAKILECSYPAGKNIGTIIGQTLTAPFTQYLIDAHHAAATGGTSKEGLKYFKSIISLRKLKNIPQKRMYIYVKEKYETDKALVENLANFITSKPLTTFINKSYVLLESYGKCISFPEDKEFHTKPPNGISLYNLAFRYTLNNGMMKSKNTDINDIAIKIEKYFSGSAYCAYSTKPIRDELVLCIYFHTSFEFGKTPSVVIANERDFWAIIEKFRVEFNKNFITNDVPNIKNAIVKTKDITLVSQTGQVTKKPIYYIQTDGIDMEHILRINVVDKSRTNCSHIKKTYKIFGTIAAKEICINELEQTLATLNLAYNNFTFLSNLMFENGKPSNLGEVGQKKREGDDIFLLAAHRGPMNNITNGAINNLETRIDSPTANLMVGQVPKIGTNYNGVYYKEITTPLEEELI